ncbi:alkanesulfonate monooxygenase [Caballeronia mineralivorans PML1(12)]|uniref:Alkanesulfonate monooxygenase n=1 Tax=Caballeronia mineralivorans PML1(12) TaxID=908627 RepID=A0A0J1D3B3_9BURK|nr:LLM class flavin-dependent oxidoreductase [Caballeronia mineralivorans]KLU27161.1 alkanesulfonate monooxygenase [Caballeronia mineralivorans PML1(12)]
MSVKFFGLLNHEYSSETVPKRKDAPVMDVDYMVRRAKEHEQAGFDRVLIAHHSSNPDGFVLASHIAQNTTTLKFMIAHRPGFIAPTYAARMWSTFDQVYGGRAGIHIISGGNDADQRADGDFFSHAERYKRTDEWLTVFRKMLTENAPFDYSGEFFKTEQSFSKLKPLQKPHFPIFFGGASDDAIQVGSKHVDYWALYGEPLAETQEMISRIRASAQAAGRDPNSIQFVLTFRPVVGQSEAEAWKKADDIIARIKELRGASAGATKGAKPDAVSSQRLRDIAAQGKVRDARLWTEVAAAIGGGSNSTGLVGTAEQIAESLKAYHDLGVTAFLVRGFDPASDIQEFGRDLIPVVNEYIGETDPAVSR